MNIIIPLIIVALIVGLSAKKMTPGLWFLVGVAIISVMTNYYVKN